MTSEYAMSHIVIMVLPHRQSEACQLENSSRHRGAGHIAAPSRVVLCSGHGGTTWTEVYSRALVEPQPCQMGKQWHRAQTAPPSHARLPSDRFATDPSTITGMRAVTTASPLAPRQQHNNPNKWTTLCENERWRKLKVAIRRRLSRRRRCRSCPAGSARRPGARDDPPVAGSAASRRARRQRGAWP